MGKAFKMVNNGHRTNFSVEKSVHGSIYIKPSSEYNSNSRKSYTLNFYNKADWLKKQQDEEDVCPEHDIMYAEDVLRLEVQCTYGRISKMSKDRTLRELFDYQVAFKEISDVYKLVLKGTVDLDFYKYQSAKQCLSSGKALEVLRRSSQHHSITGSTNSHGVRQIKAAGIYPYAFLPNAFPVDVLSNPLRLIRQKIGELQ